MFQKHQHTDGSKFVVVCNQGIPMITGNQHVTPWNQDNKCMSHIGKQSNFFKLETQISTNRCSECVVCKHIIQPNVVAWDIRQDLELSSSGYYGYGGMTGYAHTCQVIPKLQNLLLIIANHFNISKRFDFYILLRVIYWSTALQGLFVQLRYSFG